MLYIYICMGLFCFQKNKAKTKTHIMKKITKTVTKRPMKLFRSGATNFIGLFTVSPFF